MVVIHSDIFEMELGVKIMGYALLCPQYSLAGFLFLTYPTKFFERHSGTFELDSKDLLNTSGNK